MEIWAKKYTLIACTKALQWILLCTLHAEVPILAVYNKYICGPTYQVNELAGCHNAQTRAAAKILMETMTRQAFLKIVNAQNGRKKWLETCLCAAATLISNSKGSVSWALYIATPLTSSWQFHTFVLCYTDHLKCVTWGSYIPGKRPCGSKSQITLGLRSFTGTNFSGFRK